MGTERAIFSANRDNTTAHPEMAGTLIVQG